MTGFISNEKEKKEKKQYPKLHHFKSKAWIVPLTFTFLVFGFFLAAQYNIRSEALNSLENQDTGTLVALNKNLTDKNKQLEQELEKLYVAYSTVDARENIIEQIESLKMFSGVSGVQGQGISIELSEYPQVANFDLVDIVNELYATGAEAVSVNDVRVLSTSSIVANSNIFGMTKIYIDGVEVSSPFIIRAIGDSHVLSQGMGLTGGVLDNLKTIFKIESTITQEENLILPPAKIKIPIYVEKPVDKQKN